MVFNSPNIWLVFFSMGAALAEGHTIDSSIDTRAGTYPSLMPYALDVIGSVTRLDSLLSYDILGVLSPNCRFKVLSSSKFKVWSNMSKP